MAVESPENHKGTGSPTSWSGAFRAAKDGLCWARTEGTEGQAVGGSQFAISLGFLSSADAAPGVTGARNASLMVLPMCASLPSIRGPMSAPHPREPSLLLFAKEVLRRYWETRRWVRPADALPSTFPASPYEVLTSLKAYNLRLFYFHCFKLCPFSAQKLSQGEVKYLAQGHTNNR